MSAYSFALLNDLRDTPIFRAASGRSFTPAFTLSDGTCARICVQGSGYADGPYSIRVVDDNQKMLGEASIVSGTCQVFRTLSLLVHFNVVPV